MPGASAERSLLITANILSLEALYKGKTVCMGTIMAET